MIRFDRQNKTFYSTFINDNKYFSGFGTRLMGNIRNASDIEKYFNSINCNFSLIGIPVQKHSTNIESVSSNKSDKNIIILNDRDGLSSKENGTALVAWTADCVPIMFADKKNGIVGISHAGWRGTAGRMAAKMVASMIESGAEKDQIRIAIGPSIGACCYDIDAERSDIFRNAFPDFAEKIISKREGKLFLNLLYTNYLLLQSEGIPKEHIDFFPFCTKCDSERFFSYRREKEDHGNMISFIMRRG